MRTTAPSLYSLLAPEVFIEDNLSIEGRSSFECYKRYRDFLENKLIREFNFLRRPIVIYPGRKPNKTMKKIKSAQNKGLLPNFVTLKQKLPREKPPILCTCNPRPKRFFPSRMYQCYECGANQHKICAIIPLQDKFVCANCLSNGSRKLSCPETITSESYQ